MTKLKTYDPDLRFGLGCFGFRSINCSCKSQQGFYFNLGFHKYLEFDRTEKHLISQGLLTNPTQTSLKKKEHFLYVKYNFHQVIAALLGICSMDT